MRHASAEDEQQSRCLQAIWLASEIMPGSATTVASVRWWAVLKALMTGSIVAVFSLVASTAATLNRNPAASVNKPRMIWGPGGQPCWSAR